MTIEGWSLTSQALHFSIRSNLDKTPVCRLNGYLPADSSNLYPQSFFFPTVNEDKNHLDCNIIYVTVEYHYSRDFDLKSRSNNSAFFWILLFMILLLVLISLIISHLCGYDMEY